MTTLSRSLRVTEGELIVYRRTWRGSVFTSFVTPVLYLTALGLGLGASVDGGPADLGIPYLAFLATGLLAATAMQTAAGEGTYPVMAGLKWRKNFFATISTPVGPEDIIYGRLMFGAIRLTLVLSVFAVVSVIFGAMELGPALMAVAPGVLTGLAFLSCITAWTVTRENELALSSLFRFGIVPLFLFSGTFFPVSQLPDFLQPVAYVTPLFHGVELVRKAGLPGVGPEVVSPVPVWVSVAYLTAMVVVGAVVGVRVLERRLKP